MSEDNWLKFKLGCNVDADWIELDTSDWLNEDVLGVEGCIIEDDIVL